LTEIWSKFRTKSSKLCVKALTMRAMVDVEVDDSNSKLMTNKSEIDKLWSATQKGSIKRSKRVSIEIF
jgi:hypothetical protein